MTKKFLAFDLGAESGRALVGTLQGGKLTTDVVHRFPTRGVTILGTRQWDITGIHEEIIRGISLCVRDHGPDFTGIAIDTWGVDFGFLDQSGTLLGNPGHYRDTRTDGMADLAYKTVPEREIYERTGIVSLPFNTIYQLLALQEAKAPVLQIASDLLFIGPLLGYWLTGVKSCEYTIASTAQMLKAGSMEWDADFVERLGIPTRFLSRVTPPGTILGPVLPEVCAATGLKEGTRFISGAIHDTACAVVAAPAVDAGSDWAYLSSGTWSLLGAELDKPHISDASLDAFFTNEGGVSNTIRFLKNIIGLWIIQECRRAWIAEAGGKKDGLEYATLAAEAGRSEPFRSVINLEDKRLLAPDDMPEMLRTLCREAGEPVPETRGQTIRCAMESLALCYRENLRRMDGVLGRTTSRLHIIGGGTQNTLLNQMTADACAVEVMAGPAEATAIGNIMVQGMATGDISDLNHARRIVAASSNIEIYSPRDTPQWDAAAKRIKPQGEK